MKITKNKQTIVQEEIEITFPIYQKAKLNNDTIQTFKVLNETYEVIYSKSYNSFSITKIYYDINVLDNNYFIENDNYEIVKTKKEFNGLIEPIKVEFDK